MSHTGKRIAAVIITYHPVRERLAALLAALEHQVGAVFIVDNTPGSDSRHAILLQDMSNRYPGLQTYRMGENLGIAKALNHGIEKAVSDGFDYVYLSDQDSEPEPEMIQGLVNCFDRLAEREIDVCCVCPAYHDATTGRLFNFQAYVPGRFFYKSVPAASAIPYLEIVTTISSGSLIDCSALKTVGLMREDFFIDDVDTEWCHRARYHGLHIYGTSSVLLNHRLGDASFKLWWFGWKVHNQYSPTRLYYRFRNFVLMCRLPHVPLRWSIRAGWYWLGNLYAYTVFAPNRMTNMKAIAMGLMDGLLGHGGECRRKI